jgi:hypothetical protein
MYGVITTVPAPVEMYDEIPRRVRATVADLVVHVGRATTDTFQALEVWESKERYDRANTATSTRSSNPARALRTHDPSFASAPSRPHLAVDDSDARWLRRLDA